MKKENTREERLILRMNKLKKQHREDVKLINEQYIEINRLLKLLK